MEELKNIKVALLGSGTVGTGVYKLIERQREELPHKVGAGLTVSKVLVRDKNKKREGIDPSVLTDQWEDIITDDEIQIVVTDAKKRRQYYDEYVLQNRGVEDHSFDLYIPHCGDSVKECFLRRIPGIIREVIICNRDIDKLWTKC